MLRFAGLLALLAAPALLLGPAAAGDAKKAKFNPDMLFQRLDADKDGKLSRDEFLKMAERFREKDKARKELGSAFDKLDPEMKGVLLEQFRAAMEGRRKKAENK